MASSSHSSSVLSNESVTTSVDDSDESDIDKEEESHKASGESRAELETIKQNWYKCFGLALRIGA